MIKGVIKDCDNFEKNKLNLNSKEQPSLDCDVFETSHSEFGREQEQEDPPTHRSLDIHFEPFNSRRTNVQMN